MPRVGVASVRWIAIIVWCALAVARDGVAEIPTSAGALLKQPLSPGIIAAMVEHASRQEIQQALAEALRHESPAIRAAAARVVFVTALSNLLPLVRVGLRTESDADAVVESARAFASFSGPEDDGTFLASVKRLGPAGGRMATAFAFVRGPAALTHLPTVRQAIGPEYGESFLVAAKVDAAALEQIAATAIADGDSELFTAILRAADDPSLTVGETTLLDAMAESRAGDIRFAAARHVLQKWDGKQPLTAMMQAALAQSAMAGVGSGEAAPVVRELAARAGGRPASTSPEWLAIIDGESTAGYTPFRWASAAALLTERERERLRKKTLLFTPPRQGASRASAAATPAPTLQTLDRYPAGLLTGVLSLAGCDVSRVRANAYRFAGGQATLRPDGRVGRLTLLDNGDLDAACAAAARLLMITHVTDWRSATTTPEERLLVLPLTEDFLTCQDAPPSPSAPRTIGERMVPPKKTKDVRPVYPAGAQQRRVQGTVGLEAEISPTGCVRHMRVVTPVDARLDFSAVHAVSQWRFTPSLVDGVAVPIIITASVSFMLR